AGPDTTESRNTARFCGRRGPGKQTPGHEPDHHRTSQCQNRILSTRLRAAPMPAGFARDTPRGPWRVLSTPSASASDARNRREQLLMAQMSQVHDRFTLHATPRISHSSLTLALSACHTTANFKGLEVSQ